MNFFDDGEVDDLSAETADFNRQRRLIIDSKRSEEVSRLVYEFAKTKPTGKQMIEELQRIRDEVARKFPYPTVPHEMRNQDKRDTSESRGYHLGNDGQYHNAEWFGEKYGNYQNYSRLSDEASDMGFPDADTYKNWLDD